MMELCYWHFNMTAAHLLTVYKAALVPVETTYLQTELAAHLHLAHQLAEIWVVHNGQHTINISENGISA